MMARSPFILCIGAALCGAVVAHPAPEPRVTPTPTAPAKRDLLDIPASVTSLLGSAIPSDAAGGILPGWLTMPSDDQIKKQLGLNDTSISQLPVEVMNIPGYANWTENGWNNRIHGYVYKNPPATADQLDSAAQVFVPSLDESGFTDANRAMARNVTAALITLPVQNYSLQFTLRYNAQPAANITFPLPTDDRGEYDQFVPFTSQGLIPNGNETNVVQGLELFTPAIASGNASSYLVPPQGVTLVADIDDILRVTRIYQPADGLKNSFALPYVPWMNMPQVLKGWEQRIQGLHFHYLTTTPIKVTQFYESFTYANYPLGSYDIRPLNLTTVEQIFQVRKVNLHRIFETFPQRKFVLLGDTSNNDIMSQYPAMATDFPGQVQCILLRNTSATDSGDHFPYDTSGFKNLDNSTYMFFRTPDDIAGLDFSKGECRNASVPQNVTFEYQGLPNILGNAAMSTQLSVPVLSLLVFSFLITLFA
ncbi:hypothetical protein ACGC1H_001710 [Rhizoctonia solani]|uniref:Phosphatidate phosphatase APP1 catalytic domain-containing protein n=1 Tax=Rhizoctonia solani TaxID=456999 RepID=A0A8H3BRT1_9AGAM|nr:unnamed protein product [Rhizoctonia solani]